MWQLTVYSIRQRCPVNSKPIIRNVHLFHAFVVTGRDCTELQPVVHTLKSSTQANASLLVKYRKMLVCALAA